jgi:hypothetical protein
MAQDWAGVIRGALFGRKQLEAVPKDFWLSDSRRELTAARASWRASPAA